MKIEIITGTHNNPVAEFFSSPSSTPETDAAIYPMNGVDIVWPDFARKLERERDQAREQVQQMSESNQVLMADVRFYRNAWEQLKEAAK